MRQARNQLWRHYLIEFWNGCKALWAIARSSPSTLIAPLLLFAVLVAVGVWAVHFSAVQAARSFQEEAESVARNAAAQYRRALIDAFLPVDVLASHIRRAPDYESVSHLFNGSAALLFETVPSQALISLQLLPAGVLRMAYPPPLQQPVRVSPPLGADMFAAPHEGLQGMGIRSLADGHISIDGPMEHVPGLRALIVRQAVFVDVSHPGETFGRPDVPNPACGALCAFQPYDKSSSSAAAEAEAEAEAAGRPTGRLFWGLVAAVIHVDPFAGETAAAAAPPPFALSSLSGTDALADLTDYEHIGAAAAALRTLSELGYRYQVLITGSNQTTTIATSAPPPPQPGGGAAVVEAPIDLPGTQWVLRVSPAAAGGGGWMPRWVGGAIAAVVVSAAIAAAMLFGLLVSRRRHALLLQALLPPNMLSSGLRSAHVVEKHMRPTSSLIPESPAELLTDLLAELLAGATPDLRQVVLLRSLLLRNADWYRPLGMGGQLLHNANLESDVAQALMRQLGTCVVDDGDGGGGADGRGGFRTLGGYGEYLSLGGDSSSFDNMSAVLQQLWQQRPAAATEPVPGGGAPAQAGSAAPATPAAATSTAGAISERAVLHHIGWGLRRSRRSNGPTSAPSLAAAAAVLGAPQAAAALDDDHVDACYLPPPPKLQSAARTEAAAAAAAAKAPRGSGGGGTAVRTDGGVTGTNNNNNYNNSGSQRVLVEDELKGQTGRKAPAAPPRAIPAAALQAIPSSEGGVEAAGGRSNDSPTRHRGVAMAAAGQVGAGGGGGAGAEEAVVDVARLLSGTKDSSRRRASAVAVSSGRYRASGSCNSCGSPVAPAVGGGALTAAGAALAAAAVTASGAHVRVREEPAGPALLPSASEALIVRAPMLDKVAMLLSQAEDLQYDTWALADATGGRPLSVLAFYLFQRQGLIKRFHIKPLKLIRLLRAIEAGYNADVPYHNATHAADVLRTTHVLAHAACLTAHHVDTVGLMALYFAAIIHDFRHPGLTGDFLVATSHPLALRYNDRSPLESHHAASAFTLMAEQPELDAFEVLSREQRAAFRKQVVELVMGTDMKQHFALLSQFTNAVSAQRLKQQHKQAAAAASATASPVDGCGGGGGGAVRAHGGVVGGLLGRKKGRTLSGVTSQSDGGDRTKFNAGKLSVQRASDPAPDVDSIETGEDRARRQGSFAAISEGAMAAMAPSPAAAASPRGPPQHQQTSRFARQSLPASRANAAVVMTGTAAAAAPLPAPPADEAQRLLALQICLKVADIGHLSGTLPVHKRWLGVLEEELFRQGDRERELGLPISPLFDRTKQGVSKSQVGFFEFVALPLVRALTSAFPGATPLISCFEFNYQYWKEQQQKQQLQEQRGQEQHLKE
ncbi:hypothetical protein HYH02_013438 [Chlamydomonas schloesseri]|uniref:PDEase domain-containing protein n=1 Tax=Chlamydomonas schloesseri TaxID=2026947 RepID=A0A835VVW3_9CHLO|nr:hypothetical protein HYH02_013438 [Chlamydomonas schloesseri]|eukprot:KAG2431307.1 hypothetical protein HYH02_013438 [Chlamydomonas schloesseri]